MLVTVLKKAAERPIALLQGKPAGDPLFRCLAARAAETSASVIAASRAVS